MRLHSTLTADVDQRLFHLPPEPFSRTSSRRVLAHSLGATLYMPATRPDLVCAIRERGRTGATSIVVCLEDAIGDRDVGPAAEAVKTALGELAGDANAPLMFVRVRTVEQIAELTVADTGRILTGFVLPKFDSDRGADYLASMSDAATWYDGRLFAMPVIESPQIADPRTRVLELTEILGQLNKHPRRTLAVRIGATDIAGAVGLRRSRDTTCYDIGVVRDAITDIRAVLGADLDVVPVVTGCVWEHFVDQGARTFRTQLRQTLFLERSATGLRGKLLAQDLDGLLREISLDKINGLTGKTVIHPSHIAVVNSMLTVTHEEYCDARVIIGEDGGGVSRSPYRNKMNELGPHRGWAAAVLRRAAAFGVLKEDASWVDLLTELHRHES